MPTGRYAQVVKKGGPLELVTREVPEPGAGQVRVRVQACGVCHSDTITMYGVFPIEYPRVPGNLETAFGFATVANLINNLPVGLIGATALRASAASGHLANAMLIGIDLGPNISVTGSLATILWLIALRRENLHVSAWTFLKAGLIVTPGALLLAGLILRLTSG